MNAAGSSTANGIRLDSIVAVVDTVPLLAIDTVSVSRKFLAKSQPLCFFVKLGLKYANRLVKRLLVRAFQKVSAFQFDRATRLYVSTVSFTLNRSLALAASIGNGLF